MRRPWVRTLFEIAALIGATTLPKQYGVWEYLFQHMPYLTYGFIALCVISVSIGTYFIAQDYLIKYIPASLLTILRTLKFNIYIQITPKGKLFESYKHKIIIEGVHLGGRQARAIARPFMQSWVEKAYRLLSVFFQDKTIAEEFGKQYDLNTLTEYPEQTDWKPSNAAMNAYLDYLTNLSKKITQADIRKPHPEDLKGL